MKNLLNPYIIGIKIYEIQIMRNENVRINANF